MAEKLCSLDEWRSYYHREQADRFFNDTFSRIRGSSSGSVILVTSGAWGNSNIFSRCRHCGKISIYGVCQSCGWTTICCVCKRVEMPDGSWIKLNLPGNRKTHSICIDCARIEYPEVFQITDKKVDGWDNNYSALRIGGENGDD